jgi:threonine/homoserine/homoserine lactone efflux protein
MASIDLAAFLGISILVIVTPGQDTALTIRNTLLGGRGGGVATAAGVTTGQLTWTIATSAGLAALLVTSEPVFMVLKWAGAAYLVFLGLQALHAALSPGARSVSPSPSGGANVVRVAGFPEWEGSGRRLYLQGVLSNLGNPKMVVFFSSLLPQFVAPGQATFARLLVLGLIFCSMTFVWLSFYAVVVARVGDFLRRDRVRRALEATTGVVLIGLGLRLATERR